MAATVTFHCAYLDDGTPAAEDDPAAHVAVPKAFADACVTYRQMNEDLGDATDATPFRMGDTTTPAALRAVIAAAAWIEENPVALPAREEPHGKKVEAWEKLAPWMATCPQEAIAPAYLCANFLGHATALRMYCLRLAHELTCLQPDEIYAFLQVSAQPAKRARTES